MASKGKDLLNNTNAHLALDDLLNSEILSPETREKIKKAKARVEAESKELVKRHRKNAEPSDPGSQAAD